MPQLVNPYKDVEQHTVVSLEPYQMNSDIAINTKINLKNKVENKCNKYGFDYCYQIVELVSMVDGYRIGVCC